MTILLICQPKNIRGVGIMFREQPYADAVDTKDGSRLSLAVVGGVNQEWVFINPLYHLVNIY